MIYFHVVKGYFKNHSINVMHWVNVMLKIFNNFFEAFYALFHLYFLDLFAGFGFL